MTKKEAKEFYYKEKNENFIFSMENLKKFDIVMW